MTEPSPETLSPLRATALRLAQELGGYTENTGLTPELSDHLTPRQKALVADTFGLLSAIGFGSVTASQNRVQKNIVILITELSEAPVSESSKQIMGALTGILSQASTAGLTADNQSFTTRLSQRSP